MEDDEILYDVVSAAICVIVVATVISTAKPSTVKSLHFAMFTSPGHKHKHYDDVTHTPSHPLFARQASGWGDRFATSLWRITTVIG